MHWPQELELLHPVTEMPIWFQSENTVNRLPPVAASPRGHDPFDGTLRTPVHACTSRIGRPANAPSVNLWSLGELSGGDLWGRCPRTQTQRVGQDAGAAVSSAAKGQAAHSRPPSHEACCAVCGAEKVIPSLARDCEARHAAEAAVVTS